MISLQPLGDQGALATFADESDALRFAARIRAASPPWLLDVVQAYSTVAVYHDIRSIAFAQLETLLLQLTCSRSESTGQQGKLHRIPCCYERQLDLQRIVEQTRLSEEDVLSLHAATVYTVYAIGFCPGFPYLGYLPSALSGVPRLTSPRLRVERGSVGLTGRQTGIYTEVRPGGWNIIGRTPLELVNVADGYFPLRTGDRVQFERIDETAFRQLSGERL